MQSSGFALVTREDVSGHAASERGQLVGGRPIPWFEPLAAHLASTWARKQSASAVASTAALAEGRWWTPQRLYEAGFAEHPFCELCGEVGDLPHRMGSCPRRKPFCDEECPPWLAVNIQKQKDNIMFTTGLPARPCPPPVPPPFERTISELPSQGAVVSGMVYTGGALKGLIPCARRVGWAFVVIYEG